jgi:HSP20 family protein
MADKRSDMTVHEAKHLAGREPTAGYVNPFRMLERAAEEIDRVFDDFWIGRGSVVPRFARRWLRSPGSGSLADRNVWTPDIDMFQRDHALVVRVDLPGLRKEDVKVEVTDDTVTIQGERHHEAEDEQGGVYRLERGYGSFSRMISLPQGTITDQAKASFKDGVLEITMPAPPEQVTRGRRLEIT